MLVRHPVGQPGAAFVEQDEAREGREALVEPSNSRVFPTEFDVADPTRREHEVDGTVANDLVGDVEVAALCVARLGHLHATRLPPA